MIEAMQSMASQYNSLCISVSSLCSLCPKNYTLYKTSIYRLSKSLTMPRNGMDEAMP